MVELKLKWYLLFFYSSLSSFSLALKGFASLEAKRKFRAPRISPTTANQSTLDPSSVSPLEHETLEAVASEIKNSAASVVASENWGSAHPANNHVSFLNKWPVMVKIVLIIGS